MLGKQAIAYQNNASLAYTAALDELFDLGYLYHLKLAEQIEAITKQMGGKMPNMPGLPGLGGRGGLPGLGGGGFPFGKKR